MLINERLDELSNFILLVARKLAGLLENPAQFARRALPSRVTGVASNQKISRDTEGVSECG